MDRSNSRAGEAGNSVERFLALLDHDCDVLRADLSREGVEVRAGDKDLRFRGPDNEAFQAPFRFEEIEVAV